MYPYPERLKTIAILKVLFEHSNEHNKLTHDKISEYLMRDYGLSLKRKAIGEYLALFRELDYVEGSRGVFIKRKYADEELRILIDSILFAPYIPADKAKELINKLKAESPLGLSNKIKNVHYVQDFSRTSNEDLYTILDKIDEAIEKKAVIEIKVYMYGEDAKLHYVRTDRIHPYYIVNSNSRYYVICYAERNQLESRRIDRISEVTLLSDTITPLRKVIGEKQNFDLAEYMNEHIYMFSGESLRIKMKLKQAHIGYFIDWYGPNYSIIEKDDKDLVIGFKANVNATYYWALQYGHLVEIIEPVELRNKMKTGLEEILKKYE